jgi:DNA-binding NarL/FixJ family response regulator
MSIQEVRIRLAIICPQPLLAAGLAILCQEDSRFTLVRDSPALAGMDEVLANDRPHVTLIDWEVVAQNVEASKQIRVLSRSTQILFLMHQSDSSDLLLALELGGRGVLAKTETPEAICEAICRVSAGGSWGHLPVGRDENASAEVPRKCSDPVQRAIAGLTPRERQIIELICRGYKNRQIALELNISETTVCHHLTSIFSKVEVEDRVGLLVFAHKHSLYEARRASHSGSGFEPRNSMTREEYSGLAKAVIA